MRFAAALALASLSALAAADFVHVVQDANGVWWFEHNGARFIKMAINHVNNGGPDDGVDGRESVQCQAATNNTLCGDTLSFSGALNFAPYFNVTQDKYGTNQSAWASAAVSRLQGYGFNTLSGWSARVAEVAAANAGMYYAHLLDIGVTWLTAWSNGLDFDVWSSNFTDQAAAIAAKSVPPRANDEYLLGWQLDNEINWNVVGLQKYVGTFSPSAPGNAEALAWLQARYGGSVAALNAAWLIDASSWSDVRNHLNDPGMNKTAFEADDADFIGVVAARYFNVTTSAIRAHDSQHLILGVRFDVLTPQIVAAAAPFIDVFDQHSYADLPPIAWLQQIHTMTGKPVYVGEFSFTSLDSNMPNTHGARAGNPCTTQTQRARMWTAFVRELVVQPWCIGWGHWQYADEPAAGRWPDGENSNYGIVSLADVPYDVFVDAIQALQTNATAWHAAGVIPPSTAA